MRLHFTIRKFCWRLIFLLLPGSLLVAMVPVQAQKLTPTVTDAYGYRFSRQGTYVDMSVGELAVTTIGSAATVITQGFLQPISIEQPCDNPTLVYYPNPVTKTMTLSATDCDVYVNYVEAYDLFGKAVLASPTNNNQVDLSPIGVGVYILRAYAEDGRLIGTVKIIKITA